MRKDNVYKNVASTSGLFKNRKIVYCYGQWQECFKDMAQQVPEDIPSIFPPNCRPGILIRYDIMRNCSDHQRVPDLFTLCHTIVM